MNFQRFPGILLTCSVPTDLRYSAEAQRSYEYFGSYRVDTRETQAGTGALKPSSPQIAQRPDGPRKLL